MPKSLAIEASQAAFGWSKWELDPETDFSPMSVPHALGTKRSRVLCENLQHFAQAISTICHPHQDCLASPACLATMLPYKVTLYSYRLYSYFSLVQTTTKITKYTMQLKQQMFISQKFERRWASPGTKSHQILNLASAHFPFSFADGRLLIDLQGVWRVGTSFRMFHP